MHLRKRRVSSTHGDEKHDDGRALPSWLGPLPTGPVVFDPSLRRASELVGDRPRTAARGGGRLDVAAGRPAPGRTPPAPATGSEPLIPHRGHAA